MATILGSTVVFLDSTVVNVALPTIQEDLDTGLAGQQWVVEAYLLTLVAFLLVGGSLGDLFGRRRIFVVGLVGFAITSVLCAIAPTDETLVGARALQGIAGALLVPGSLAILAASFEGEARGRAVGLWTAWAGISTLIGPAGGGLLVELDWRLIFWVNVPLIAATVWLALRAVPESSDPEAVHGIDWLGIALSALGLAGPVFALIEQPLYGFSDPIVWGPLVGGIACLVLFVWWESRARAPVLPLELFRSHNFSTVNLATLCVYAALGGAFFFITLFLQQVAGYTAFQAGAATTPVTVLMFALSGRFGALASRIGPRLPMGVGPLIGAIGLGLLVGLDSEPDYVTQVLPAMVLFGLGLSMTVAPLTTTVLDSVEERHVGVASGVNNAVARVAGVLAIAALGAVVSAQFSSTLDDRTADRQLSAEAAEAVESSKEQPLSGGDVSGVPDAEAAIASSRHPRLVGVGLPARDADRGRADGGRRRDRPRRCPQPGARARAAPRPRGRPPPPASVAGAPIARPRRSPSASRASRPPEPRHRAHEFVESTI